MMVRLGSGSQATSDMALQYAAVPPLEQSIVALDLETTGLNPNNDAILEVGAVRFRGGEVLETFQRLVNPGRPIPDYVQRLTGIAPRDIQRAPAFSSIAPDLQDFIGGDPVLGHNIQFDLRFLNSAGLSLPNPAYDTFDLATVLLPKLRRYALGYLAGRFGVAHDKAHRALDDAQATRQVFLYLLRLAERQDGGLLGYIGNLAQRGLWPTGAILGQVPGAANAAAAPAVTLNGLDRERLAARIETPVRQRTAQQLTGLTQDRIPGMLGPAGPFAKTFSGFEHRPQQEEMLAAVAEAIYNNRHLVVEGGTGVGKSVAYLLPAILFAISKGQRVVISTNTINLQEQLITKDIPDLQASLEASGILPPDAFNAALLKGRGNYLCLRRWSHLARSESLASDDARILAKTAVWLQDTGTGDRGELNLIGRENSGWNHLSAGEGGFCPALRDGSPCFLRAARERAEQADIVVVNHALLLSDLRLGGGLIPDYQHLIIDEAHHLEDQATQQFGFELSPPGLEEAWEPHGRLCLQTRQALSGEELSTALRREGDAAATAVETESPRLHQAAARLWSAVERLMGAKSKRQGQGGSDQLLITPQVRGNQGWAELYVDWENLDVALLEARNALSRLHRFLDSATLPAAEDLPALVSEAAGLADEIEALRLRFHSILGEPEESAIHWVELNQQNGAIFLKSAPLEVASTLREILFDRKDSVILTSATLTAADDFEYFRNRVGAPEDAAELLVGSPFDYRRAAQLLAPEDMPAPSSDRYVAVMTQTLTDLARALNGHTMALFTSHAALRAVAQRLRAALAADGIEVMAQGVDGSAPQLMAAFPEAPNSVLLGTASFWEGVDMPSGALKALVIARLPFQVPTHPVVMARSALYADAFNDYSVPNAVLRFRQGIGRLIRNKSDRGTIVLLDQRVTGRAYGQAFLRSIPPCTETPCSAGAVGALAAHWVGGNRGTLR